MTINNIFDIPNTQNLQNYGFKKPLSLTNANEILSFIDHAKEYLLSLNIDILRKRTIKKSTKQELCILQKTYRCGNPNQGLELLAWLYALKA